MCEDKNRYPDEFTARAAGIHYIERGDVAALWVYRCPICRGFHLTRSDHGKRANVMFGVEPSQTSSRDVK
ncbi:MAG: hypothetical protein QJR04_25325 [Burkholderia multivorans]|nr:hypothetical protein [Burkholderia multivorans]